MMCRVLGVSRSGFYAWETREPCARAVEDAGLSELIGAAHLESRRTYGARRIHIVLARKGVRCGKKRVARLMQAQGIQGVHRRRKFRTTIRDHGTAPAADLVDRNFKAPAPNILWVADITYVPTWSGWLYVAIVLDVFSRRVVGWSMADHLRTELVLDALDMALWSRQPDKGLIHHSDRGSQYTSISLGRRCQDAGVMPSMGSKGDAYDNSVAESFFATLETELLWPNTFKTRTEARIAVFDFIECFYNTKRLHSSVEDWPPAEYERRHQERIDLTQLETVH